MDTASGGRGLGNIRLQACQMGLEVRFDDAKPSTCVRFLLPAEQPTQADPPGTEPQPQVFADGTGGFLAFIGCRCEFVLDKHHFQRYNLD